MIVNRQHPSPPALFLSLPIPPTNNNQPATLSVRAPLSCVISSLLRIYFRFFFICSVNFISTSYSTTVSTLRFPFNGFLTGEAFLWFACGRKASLSHQSQQKKHVLFKK